MKKISEYSDSELAQMLSEQKKVAEQAFAELYSRYSQRIYAYCLKVTGDSADARDIFQDTFMKFYNSAKEKVVLSNVPGYLITIARNLCLNFKRNKKPNESLEEYHFNNYSDSIHYEEKELIKLIDEQLDKMGFEYKEAFVLRQYQGYSYQEIAEITGDTASAIKNRVWRAKEKIKSALAPYLDDMYN
jgi:RNA polymerase sigma-70 factor, ECF subfamily